MAADIRTRRLAFALLLVVAIAALALTGCSVEPTVAEEGQFTCIECHTDRELLKADLEADPKPEKVVAESEGEG